MQTADDPDHNRAHLPGAWRVDEVIEIACHLAGRDAIGSIHVEVSDRPTHAALLRYRRRAHACGLTLEMTRSTVVLRPRASVAPERDPIVEHAFGRSARWWRGGARRPGLNAPGQWWESRVQRWRAGSSALSEGTR